MRASLEDIRRSLGKPDYESKNVLLYKGDCRDFLPALPMGSIPLTVTSPPYNIGKDYETIVPVERYLDWTAAWTDAVHAATAENGAFWLNVGYMPLAGRAKAVPIPYLLWDRIRFFLIQEIVWNYGAGVAGKLFFSPRNEKFLWYVKDQKRYVFNLDDVRDPDVKYPRQMKNGKLKCNPRGKNPTDVWQIPKVTSGARRSSRERTPHPAQFPLTVVSRVILASSHAGDVVLDPFSGSGSTLDAALRTGRKAVGFEIDARYVDLATERLEASRRQWPAGDRHASCGDA